MQPSVRFTSTRPREANTRLIQYLDYYEFRCHFVPEVPA